LSAILFTITLHENVPSDGDELRNACFAVTRPVEVGRKEREVRFWEAAGLLPINALASRDPLVRIVASPRN
jgi:hypothetical protein